jgi:hypothetical protein
METHLIDETTALYLGHWRRLVSTTNWEKGRIISQWRQTRAEAGATLGEISDEAWSRSVGNVTAQHVGRLRRAWERFSAVRNDYEGLYWSHFQAATEWDDAEMWLEGAMQSDWSVMDMRRQRAATLGLVDSADSEPSAAEPVDEDAEATPGEQRSLARESLVRDPAGDADDSRGAAGNRRPSADNRDAADDEHGDEPFDGPFDGPDAAAQDRGDGRYSGGKSPLADLPSLPADVSDAFEAFKLCILRHKLAGWTDLSREDLLRSLDALKELALATAM